MALHAHDYVIARKTYEESSLLNNFFNVLAVDTHEGTEFVMAVEAKNYPIAGTMNHPETQNIRVFGEDDKALKGKVNTADTDEINFYFSSYLNKLAKQNLDTHRFHDLEFGKRMTFKNAYLGFTRMYSSLVLTYGI